MIFDGDRDQLVAYMRFIADIMGLQNWRLSLSDEPPAGGNDAAPGFIVFGQANVNPDYMTGQVSLLDEWAERDEGELRHTIVHEFLHFHMAKMSGPINDLENALGFLMFNPLADAMNRMEELTIEGITSAWAPMLPLPCEWLKAETEG